MTNAENATAKPPKPQALFEYVSKHFLLISALSLVVWIIAATTGLYAYLTVFDWHLIWLIEYADILKVGLVTLGVVSGLAAIVSAILDNTYLAVSGQQKAPLIIYFSLTLIGAGIEAYVGWDKEGIVALTIMSFLSYLALVWAGFIVMTALKAYPNLTARSLLNDCASLIVIIAVWGLTVGLRVYHSEGYKHHVTTKTAQFRSVGLVMITSRFVVLYDRDHSLVIPVDDVTEIEGQPKPSADK